MKDIRNTAVLAVLTHKMAVDEEKNKVVVTFMVATLVNENGSFELPYCTICGTGDLRAQLLDSFYRSVSIDKVAPVPPEQLRMVGSYSVEHDDYLEIVNAFMVLLDGKPAIQRNEGDKTPAWVNIDVFDCQHLHGNQNRIIDDLKERLLEAALAPTGGIALGEQTKQAIIASYSPKSKEERRSWIKCLQGSGLNVYEHVHPGVAIDLVIFGYKKAEKGRRDELSVLLTYRKPDDHLPEDEADTWKGWSLPGTFLHEMKVKGPDDIVYPGLETIREAAVRVAKEKTGLDIASEEELYNMRPFVHHSRMGWKLRDGSPVITLPVFLPIKYSDVNEHCSTLTTSECRWFPIKRVLWTVNEEVEGGLKKVALRGGNDGNKKLNEDGTVSVVNDVTDDNATIDLWRTEDFGPDGLLSPEEVGLPAADAYIRNGQLVFDYYHTVIRPHRPVQDKYYDKYPDRPEGVELMIADHANIIISALQEIAGNTRRTLHIVSKLLSGGTFSPTEIKRMLETWFFPWAFSRSNMQKKLRDTNKLIKEVVDEKAGESKRSWSYRFVDADEIDSRLQDSKPF